MKKAIFIGIAAQTNRVYSAEVFDALQKDMDFPFGFQTFSREALKNYDLKEISFLFSTWGMPELTEEEIAAYFPVLECVFYAAGSVQNFARPFLNRGIRVFSAWAANGIPVAEYTLAQIILADTGYYCRLHTPGAGSQWVNRPDVNGFPGNYDSIVGIIGAGMIGKLVIERIHAVLERIHILVYDPFLPAEKALELKVTLCDLPTLFSKSDVISNHLANNPQTAGILDGKLFTRMKPYSTFINTGRGAQVVEKDLIRALTDIPTRSAILDVTDPEPPESDSPFYRMKNVFLSPHIAGSLGNEVHRMANYMLEESRLYNAGLPSHYEVTLEMLKTMA